MVGELFGVSIGRNGTVVMQTDAVGFLTVSLVETHILATKQEIFRCISTSSSSIDKACYIVRRIYQRNVSLLGDTHFQLVD
jgi:hypothetical protein